MATCVNRETKRDAKTTLWRAQSDAKCEEVTIDSTDEFEVLGWEDVPLPSDRMKPLSANWNSGGRASPRGISYLYLATNQDTALAEVRPWLGSKVTVGEFALVRDLMLIDCSRFHTGVFAVVNPDLSGSREDGVWSAIDKAFAKPVGPDDDKSDYIPTQILGELFKDNGYDGIIYKNLLGDVGPNVALFNPRDAESHSCSLVKVSRVKFDYVKLFGR